MPVLMGIYDLPGKTAGAVTQLRGRGFADLETFGQGPVDARSEPRATGEAPVDVTVRRQRKKNAEPERHPRLGGLNIRNQFSLRILPLLRSGLQTDRKEQSGAHPDGRHIHS